MAWFFLPRMAAAAITLVVLVVLTRALGPAEFGRYNITMVVGTVAYAGIFAWLSAAITRFYAAPEFDGKAVAAALGLGARLILPVLLVLLLALLFLTGPYQLAVVLGACFCLSHALHEIGLSGLRVQGAGPAFAFSTLLRPLIGVALALALVFAGAGYGGALAGMALGAAVTGVFALWRVIRLSGITTPDLSMLSSFYSIGMPLAIVSSASMLLMLLSQTALGTLAGLDAVGIFAAAQVLAMRSIDMPMTTLSRASAASIFASFETHGHAESNRELSRHFSLLLLVSVPVAATLILANDTVSRMIFDQAFGDIVSQHLPLLAIAAFLSGIQGAYYDYAFTLARRTTLQLYIMAGLLAVHAVLSVILIWLLGPIGASWAVLATSATGLVTYAQLGKRIRPIGLPMGELKVMGLATAAFAPFALAADASSSLALALVFLASGAVAFVVVLHIARHEGLRIVKARLPGRWYS
ncbi:MAG: oligosaccharide flippase family protein [Litoreibacter sp.]|nr:oligosaccharide flippase family protein [Litoreibacter sp.]